MLVPNRNSPDLSRDYRYGFQGQEMDNELKGRGNSLNYTFRMHDPRVGRFFARDPLESRYPFMTPYQFSSNSPIGAIEIEGLEGEEVRFRQYMRSQGGVQAQAVQTEQDMQKEIVKFVLVDIPEATIDGVTYTVTSLFQAGIGGFSFGYGDLVFSDGYKTKIDIPSIGFTWKKGFQIDSKASHTGSVSFKDGLRMIDGVSTIVGTTGSISKFITPTFKTGSHLLTKGKTLFGGSKIILSSNKTTTILGRFYNGVEHVKATGMFRMGQNTGGVNILNVPDKAYKEVIAKGGDDLFWETYNKPWLDSAIKRNDNIRLVSDPSNPKNLFINGVDGSDGRTMFGREVEHLENNGYKFEGANAVKK